MPPINLISPPPALKKDRRRHRSADKEASSSATLGSESAMASAVPDLAGIFKQDLTNIKSLVTCSICDQLLYEPWTLACGHTYCYSCLNSWFIPNARKKTCPECRTKVSNIPAPNFLIKQMVEIFTKRIELMPADESIEQHNTKSAEEVADVEKDKNSANGLFKGLFPKQLKALFHDEEDGVLRCPHCNHEYEGGDRCSQCDMPVDEQWSDMDEEGSQDGLEIHGDQFFAHDRINPAIGSPFHHRHHDFDRSSISSALGSELEDSEDSDEGGSMQDFVVQDDGRHFQDRRGGARPILSSDGIPTEDEDDAPPRRPIPRASRNVIIVSESSGDDSDEGGEVTNRRSRRRNISSNTASPSILTVTDGSMDGSMDGSEAGDMNSEADRLRIAGWSPLEPGNDSDVEAHERYGYGSTLDGNDSDEDSDTNTETMAGNIPSDDEEGNMRDDMSDTPTYDGPDHYQNGYGRYPPEVYEHMGDDESDDDSTDTPQMLPYSGRGEDGTSDDDSVSGSSVMLDRDGDTEMSASPDARRSISVSTNPYRNDSELRSSRQASMSSTYASDFQGFRGQSVSTVGDGNNYQHRPENLGLANQVLDEQDDSSDASLRPPVRRRRPRYNLNARVQQYDPRISMLFADHQQVQNRDGSRENPVELDEMEIGIIEPASRNRRMTAYQAGTGRQSVVLSSSRSPSASASASRVVASSSRTRRSARNRSYN